jgi:hypothetical protein
MRRLATLVAATVVSVTTADARAEEPAAATASSRGALTGTGLALVSLGLGALGLGLAGLLNVLDANALLQVYLPSGGAPAAADAQTVVQLSDRVHQQTTLAAVGLSAAAGLLVAGTVCLVLDRPHGVRVGLVPTAGGGLVTAALPW